MTLCIVWDTSGSMAEWAKVLVARGVARAIEQYVRLGYGSADLKLVAWSHEACVLDWTSDREFPREVLVPGGSANAKALTAFFGTELPEKVLLLTDGFWSNEDAEEIKRWKHGLPPDTIRIIKIGADASTQVTGSDVFVAEDVFAALDGWVKGGGA